MEPYLRQEVSSAPCFRSSQELAEVFGDKIPDLCSTLWDVFSEAATAFPEREAVISSWQPRDSVSALPQRSNGRESDTKGLRWSYSELKSRAASLADCLANLGCQPGMHLAAVLWNSAEWALFFWASAKIGMVFVPIDPSMKDDARMTIHSLRPDVVVVQDAEEASDLDLEDGALNHPRIRIHCSERRVPEWLKLCELSTSNSASETFPRNCVTGENMYVGNGHADAQEVALVVYTSGTTGTPKGCQHTNHNLISQSHDFDPEIDPSVSHRWLVHTPVFHIFAINNALRAWRYGGVVVFPSKAFNVDATLDALIKEQCTVMSATPTLVKALIAHPSFPSAQQLSLHLVTIGGTSIVPEDIRLCRQILGADHAIQVYGMSETGPVVTWKRSDPSLVEGYHAGVGRVLPGAAARVCRPRSREVLHRSEIGELHIGGSCVISSYRNGDDEGVLYSDISGTWIVTGDRAQIDENGIVYILGRYKDLIIRGGENIDPVRIETELNEVSGLQSQVIGVYDEIAGQVPVAIVKSLEGRSKHEIKEKSNELGRRYALDAVYSLNELGLQSFPMTSIGKIKKEALRQTVSKIRKMTQQPRAPEIKNEQNGFQPRTVSLADRLLDIWQKLVGTRPSKSDSVMYFADSITLLRYCENVLRSCGGRLYLQDFVENDTVEKQAQLLEVREKQQAHFDAASKGVLGGRILSKHVHMPVQKSWSWRTNGDPPEDNQQYSLMNKDRVWNAAELAVLRLGFNATEIEDILTIRESLHQTVVGQRPQSFQNRVAFRIRELGKVQILRGLEKALTSRPLMRTIIVQCGSKTPYHVVLAPSRNLFLRLIHEFETEDEEAAMQMVRDDSPARHITPFMFQADLTKIGDGTEYCLAMNFSHSIIDAISLSHWHRELDRLIVNPEIEIPPLTPYKFFSDLFNRYECSTPAQESVKFHVKRLRGISRFQRALWPPQRAPGWMVSNDEGSQHMNERRRIRNNVWHGQWESRAQEFQYPRCCRALWLPALPHLKEKHGVHPSLLTQYALFIFNVLQTGSSHAILTVWESGRSWPFVPSWMESLLPPAMSIDGPTTEWILNMVEVMNDETIEEFFKRMSLEQAENRRHQHAPWGQVVQGLRDEGQVAVDASYRQAFAWDMSLGMSAARTSRIDFATLEPRARYGWADNGIYWTAFSLDKENIYFIASWDTAQMNDVEIDGYCDCLAEVIRKLADEKNWGKTIGEVFRAHTC